MLLQSHRGYTCRRFSVRYHKAAGSLSPQNSPHQDLNSQVAAIPKLITLPYPIARRDMFTLFVGVFFPIFMCMVLERGSWGFYSVYKTKSSWIAWGGCWWSVKQQNHTSFYCLRYLKHAWNCCLWVRSGFSLYFFFPWSYQDCQVFPILPEGWLEISERNSELLRTELTANTQLGFVAGLCRCYFFSSLLKKEKGLFLTQWKIMWCDWHLSSSPPCPVLHCPAGKAEEANLAEKSGGEPGFNQHWGVLSAREILSSSAEFTSSGVGGIYVQLEFFETKMLQDATRNPATSFGLNLASALCCYAAEALKLPISHN